MSAVFCICSLLKQDLIQGATQDCSYLNLGDVTHAIKDLVSAVSVSADTASPLTLVPHQRAVYYC